MIKNIPKSFFKTSTNNNIKYYSQTNFRKSILKIIADQHTNVCFMNKDLIWRITLTDRVLNGNIDKLIDAVLCEERFVVISLLLYNYIWSISHQNIIIIDKKQKSIIRFDPVGKIHPIHVSFAHKKVSLDDTLQKLFKSIQLTSSYSFIKPTNYQQLFDIQSLEVLNLFSSRKNEPNGWCVMWCAYLMHMKLLNQDIDIRDILDFIRKKGRCQLHTIIKNYTAYWILNSKKTNTHNK